MNKSHLAVAVLSAFAGIAHAQSPNAQFYGSIDGAIRHATNVDAAGESKTSIGAIGGLGASRFGIRGVEDLGNGLKATFQLEGGFNSGTGVLDNTANRLFNRTARVGLAGRWGSLNIGRQYSVSFNTIGLYEPFKITHYSFTGLVSSVKSAAGNATGMTATNKFGTFGGGRFDNDIQYSGTFNAFTLQAEHAFGEQAGNSSNGSASAVGLHYASGPIAAGAAYTAKKANVSLAGVPALWQDATQITAGAAYRTGKLRFTVGVMNDKQAMGAAKADTKSDLGWASVGYALAPGLSLITAHYRTNYEAGGVDGKKKLTMAVLIKELSKRTKLYVEADHTTFSGVAIGAVSPAGQDTQRGFALGMFHQF